MARRPETDAAWKPRSDLKILNTEIPRIDGPSKVTGQAKYTHDVRVPNMVYARMLIHPYPRSIVKRVDVEAAKEVPGVVHAEALKGEGDEVLYQGDDAILAVIAAETPEAAEDGLRAVVYEVEELYPPNVTVEQAMEEDTPPVGWDRRAKKGIRTSRPRESGNQEEAEAAFAECDIVLEAEYSLPVQHHVCLETHGHVVDYTGGDDATVYASSQMVSFHGGALAGPLELEAGNIHVVTEHMGGGFGSKFGAGVEGREACRVSKALGRPVHLMLKRRDEFLMGGNRSGSQQTLKAGLKDGKLHAFTAEGLRLGGTGGGSLAQQPYIYPVANKFSTAHGVYTATDSNRAMRAPGHPQASFAMESMVDELAYAAGRDPLTFRKENLTDEVYHRQLDAVAKEVGWESHPHKSEPAPVSGGVNIGIGFGVATWGGGGRDGSGCEVHILPSGAVTSSTGTQDLGTGSRTYVAAIVAEEFELPLEAVTPRIGDNHYPASAASGGSATTGSSAPAIKDAAHKAREAFNEHLAGVLSVEATSLEWKNGEVQSGDQKLTWAQACATLGTKGISANGKGRKHLRSGGVHGAQAAKVSVDTLTGEVKVLKMVYMQDCGLVLNRMAARSQINGGQIQALSYGLFEQRIHDVDLGLMLTDNLEDYKIAGCQEIGEIVSLLDDGDERIEPIGMAEANVTPGHGAIANALYNACGVRLRDLPLTADRVLMALQS
jgi:xanthine dehydrogenase YagR molybdenum-binding subunit